MAVGHYMLGLSDNTHTYVHIRILIIHFKIIISITIVILITTENRINSIHTFCHIRTHIRSSIIASHLCLV